MIRSALMLLTVLRNAVAQGNETADPTTSNTTASPVPTVTPLAPIPSPVPKRSCYTNLTEIEDLVKLKDPFVEETYILCPNTIFPIGSFNSEDVWVGFMPITVRANSIFQCGDDGKSANNCTIKGGSIQLVDTLEKYSNENRVGVLVKGLTFDGAVDSNVLVAAPGNITFIDCIFQNNQNWGVVLGYYFYENGRRTADTGAFSYYENQRSQILNLRSDLVSASKSYQENKQASHLFRLRQLQIAGDLLERQVITMENCLFQFNSAGPQGGEVNDGIISGLGTSNDFVLKSCTFANNSYGAPNNGVDSWAIYISDGSTLRVMDSCFIDNNFVGLGSVIVESGTADHFAESSNFGTSDDGLNCPFASVGGMCIPYGSSTCSNSGIPSLSLRLSWIVATVSAVWYAVCSY